MPPTRFMDENRSSGQTPYPFPSSSAEATPAGVNSSSTLRPRPKVRSESPLTLYDYGSEYGDFEKLGTDTDIDGEETNIPGAQGSIPISVATKAPSRPPIIVRGQKLTPTIGYNVFWWLCAERHGVEMRRRSGIPGPWTTNKILQEKFTCNTFRVLDKACQFLIRKVIETGPTEQREVLFRILLFNSFTRPSTWEYLEQHLGSLTWARYDRKKYNEVLARLKAEGRSMFSEAFQKQNGGQKDAWRVHLDILELMMENDNLLHRLKPIHNGHVYMEDIFDYLREFPYFGPFNAYQLCLNLSYSKLLECSGWDFVAPGGGARSGLQKLFGSSLKRAQKALNLRVDDLTFEADIIRYMAKHQHEEFNRLGIPFSGLDKRHQDMELADVEHVICETDKFLRRSHPSIHGGGRTSGKDKRPFSRSTLAPAPFVLPKAWRSKKRKDVMIRPSIEGKPMWTVEEILKHHIGEDGMVSFYVSWVNFPPSSDTWEPEDDFTRDVPGIVKEYLLKNNITLPVRE